MDETKKKILIVEDEQPLAKALRYKLINAGFDATAVFNGREALDILKEKPFDLMILDLIMPKTDGFEVLRKLKEQGNEIPVIVASNLGQDKDIEEAMNIGAKEYIVKSNTPLVEIIKIIKKHLPE